MTAFFLNALFQASRLLISPLLTRYKFLTQLHACLSISWYVDLNIAGYPLSTAVLLVRRRDGLETKTTTTATSPGP